MIEYGREREREMDGDKKKVSFLSSFSYCEITRKYIA